MTDLAGLQYSEIASKLAAVVGKLPGDSNAFREALQRVSIAFAPSTRNLTEARRELALLLYALTGRGEVVDLPETWIVCACTVLLMFEQMRLAGSVARPSDGAVLS